MKKKSDLYIIISAIIIIITAWFIGYSGKDKDILPILKEYAGEKSELVQKEGNMYEVNNITTGNLTGYLSTGNGFGYGGKLSVIVLADSLGIIDRVTIMNHSETVSFMSKVIRKGFTKQFNNKPTNIRFSKEDNVDVVSGATLTCNGILQAVRSASYNIATAGPGLAIPNDNKVSFVLEYRDIIWFVLLILAWLSTKIHTRHNGAIRWSVMIVSMFILGFQLNAQLSISQVNKALIGAWPQAGTQIYFYIMLAGILLLTLATGKNHYCDRICPFGTVQEILGKIGGAGRKLPYGIHKVLHWMQRILALMVIVVALITRKPGAANYEVFGAMFNLTGNMVQFGLLLFVAVTSLFIRRPWCSYLCPVRPVNDLVKAASIRLHGGRDH